MELVYRVLWTDNQEDLHSSAEKILENGQALSRLNLLSCPMKATKLRNSKKSPKWKQDDA